MKQTAAHFKKEKVPERTIHNIISKYLTYNTTEFRPKSGRPRKISDQKLRSLVKCVEDRVGVSQRRLARRFNACIRRRLLPFIIRYHRDDEILLWPDMASSHHAKSVLDCLTENDVPHVTRSQNPPNIPQGRSIESLCTIIEQSVYEGGWQANRIKAKIEELDQKMVTGMIQEVRSKLLKMYRQGVFSVCQSGF